MAKVQGPLFSVDARGKIADSLVFMGWRGIKTVRSYAVPSNPNTPDQMRVRNNFMIATQKWKELTGRDQNAWRAFASGEEYSGYNDLVGRVKETLDKNETWVMLTNATDEEVTANSANISIQSDYETDLTIRWGTASKSYSNSKTMDAPEDFATDPTYTAELTDLPPNSTIYFTIEVAPQEGIDGRTGEYTISTPAT